MRIIILQIATLAITRLSIALPCTTLNCNATATLERRYNRDPQRHSIHLGGEKEAAFYYAANGFGIVLPYRFYIKPGTPSDEGFNPWRQDSVTTWYLGLLACEERFWARFAGLKWFDDSLLEWYIRPVHAKLGDIDTVLVRIDAMYNKDKTIPPYRKVDFEYRFDWVWNDPLMRNRLRQSFQVYKHFSDLKAVGRVANEEGEGLRLDVLGGLSYMHDTHKILPGMKVGPKTEEDRIKDESAVKEDESAVKEETSDDVGVKQEETGQPVNFPEPVNLPESVSLNYKDQMDQALATAKKLLPELEQYLTWDRPESEADEDEADEDEDDDEDDEDEDDEDEDDEDDDYKDEDDEDEVKIKRPPSEDSLQEHEQKRPNRKGGSRGWL